MKVKEREREREGERGRKREREKRERDSIQCRLKRQSGMETFQKMFLLWQDLRVKRDW